MNDSDGGRDASEYGRRRGMVSLCALAGALALAGCSLALRYQAPPLPVATAYPTDTRMQPNAMCRDIAVVNYEKTVQTVFREVSDALSARQWLTGQVRISQATLVAQAERVRLARLRYDNGSAPYFEVLDAQRDLLAAEQQLVQTRRALLSSRVSLYTALGGGSQAFSAPSVSAARPAN